MTNNNDLLNGKVENKAYQSVDRYALFIYIMVRHNHIHIDRHIHDCAKLEGSLLRDT